MYMYIHVYTYIPLHIIGLHMGVHGEGLRGPWGSTWEPWGGRSGPWEALRGPWGIHERRLGSPREGLGGSRGIRGSGLGGSWGLEGPGGSMGRPLGSPWGCLGGPEVRPGRVGEAWCSSSPFGSGKSGVPPGSPRMVKLGREQCSSVLNKGGVAASAHTIPSLRGLAHP